MQLCANKWRVAELLWCQWCNPGSHRKRDWNMMRLNSPSLTFVSILYFVLFYSKILDKCNHPQLSKPLFYLHSKFPVTTWTSNFLALNSLFPKTVTKCVQEGLSRAWSRTTNISNQSKKNAKTFNACLTACWMSFSTETQQHRSTCHFSRMPPQDWNMTYMCLQRRFQPQIAMGLQIVICLLKFGQSWQVLSSCVKTGQHAEQRLTLSSDERLKTTRDWKPLFCDYVEQPRWLDTWSLVYMTNCSTILRSFDSIKFPWNVLR